MKKAITICLAIACILGLAVAVYYLREKAPAPVAKDRPTFSAPVETAPSDWKIVVFAEVDGAYGVIGRGGAHLDKSGEPVRAALTYSLPQGESRVLVDNGRTYVRSARPPYVWVDVSDPVGKIPGIAVPTALSAPQDGYSRLKGHTYGNDRFEVFERLGGVFQAEDNTVLSFKDQYWTDMSGQVRRRIGITTIRAGDKDVTLVTAAYRVGANAVPEWYHFDRLFAPDRAIPASAALRAIAYRGERETDSSCIAGDLNVLAANIGSPVRSVSLRQSPALSNFPIGGPAARDLAGPGDSVSRGARDIAGSPAGDGLISGMARLLFSEARAGEHVESDDFEFTLEETEQDEEWTDTGDWTVIEGTDEDENPDEDPYEEIEQLSEENERLRDQIDAIDERLDRIEDNSAPDDYSVSDLAKDELGLTGAATLSYAIMMLGVGASTPFVIGGLLVIGGVVALVGGGLYLAPIIAGFVNGDPHIATLDGHTYVFQATGEFIVVDAPRFQIQQRFEGDKGVNTSVRATAIRAGNHVIEFSYTATSGKDGVLPAIVDGGSMEVDGEGLNFDDGTYVAQYRGSGGNDLIVVGPDGSYAVMENLDRAQNVFMALSPNTGKTVTGGLAGVPDGKIANDFTLRDGTVMAMGEAHTIEGLYGRFASSWRVRPDERLFTQGKAEDYLTPGYTDLPRSITKFSDFSESDIADARQTCIEAGVEQEAALDDCAYDVLASGGDAGWARMAASSGTVAASVASAPSAVAAIVEAKMPGDAPSGQQFWWTIVNRATEKTLTRNGDRQVAIDLPPGSYSVKVVAGIFEGEETIDVRRSEPNEFSVNLWNREIPVLLSPETVSAGGAMVFEWRGPLSGNGYIIVMATNAYKGYYDAWNHHRAVKGSPATLVAPVKPGSFEILYVDDLTETILFRKPLEVTPAELSFTGPGEVSAGAVFEFSWDGPNAKGDFIFIAKPDAKPDFDGGGYSHLTGKGASGRLTAPASPGEYELRYYSYGNQRMLAKRKLTVR